MGDEVRPVDLPPRGITRELEAMSDWELERGLASSTGFDQDRRVVDNRILRERHRVLDIGGRGGGGCGRTAGIGGEVHEAVMQNKLEDELDQLSDEEIEKRLAAAIWVDDKRAAVLRYLEEKSSAGRKRPN